MSSAELSQTFLRDSCNQDGPTGMRMTDSSMGKARSIMRNGLFLIRGSQTQMRNRLLLIGESPPRMRNGSFQIRESQTQMRNELFLIRDPGFVTFRSPTSDNTAAHILGRRPIRLDGHAVQGR